MRAAVVPMVLAGVLSQPLLASQATQGATYRMTGSRIAIGQDVRVESDEEVSDTLIVIGGSATIEGRVRDGIVVVGGDAHLGPRSDVAGEIVLVGGHLIRDEGARHFGRVNYISFGDWWNRSTPWLPRVTFGEFGRWVSLAGTMVRISLLAVLMGFTLLIARAPVARVGRAAAAEPLRAVLVGLAAEIFFIPLLVVVCLALAITIIGLPFLAIVIPLVIATAFFALVLGYTALACRIGEWIEDRLGWHPGSAFLATGIGFLLIVGPTLLARMLTVATGAWNGGSFALSIVGMSVEFLVWTVGLGAAIMTGLGRWHTTPPPIAVQTSVTA
jgi:hypothetical protein